MRRETAQTATAAKAGGARPAKHVRSRVAPWRDGDLLAYREPYGVTDRGVGLRQDDRFALDVVVEIDREFLHDAPRPLRHDADPVREIDRLADVMRHHQHRFAGGAPKPQ